MRVPTTPRRAVFLNKHRNLYNKIVDGSKFDGVWLGVHMTTFMQRIYLKYQSVRHQLQSYRPMWMLDSFCISKVSGRNKAAIHCCPIISLTWWLTSCTKTAQIHTLMRWTTSNDVFDGEHCKNDAIRIAHVFSSRQGRSVPVQLCLLWMYLCFTINILSAPNRIIVYHAGVCLAQSTHTHSSKSKLGRNAPQFSIMNVTRLCVSGAFLLAVQSAKSWECLQCPCQSVKAIICFLYRAAKTCQSC